VVTPALSGSILPGITRNSVIQLCKSWGYEVEERKISVDELLAAQADGTLEECFGTGTAAVISPVGKIDDHGKIIEFAGMGPVIQKLYDTLTGIQMGRIEAPAGWIQVIE
jgi:branched-chain amino acid aminotransferase